MATLISTEYEAEGTENSHTITLNDAELNTLILGLDALIDEWFDQGKKMEGYEWVGVADGLLADFNSRRDVSLDEQP